VLNDNLSCLVERMIQLARTRWSYALSYLENGLYSNMKSYLFKK